MPRPTTPRREKDRDRDRDRDRSKDKDKDKDRDEYGVPGAGTLYVYGVNPDTPRGRSSISPGRSKRSSKRVMSFHQDTMTWEEIIKVQLEPTRSKSPDVMLEKGIEVYTFIPAYAGGLLGRGKFSAVYKVLGPDGHHYALKHTPLHPHHPLIAARLLREPTLLAQLPPHPCLIGVEGWVRTQGHFYLIEQYPSSYISLPSHPLPLKPSRAAYILDQLVSVVRDCLHNGGRVVHRDLKGENVLIDVETGNILLLDLGLATHYSASEPKLTTCCGSPAFHSPEIVHALNHPPGEVSYYGPELDIWCIGLTLLSLLLHTRFPLGPSHKSPHIMRDRVLDRLQELDEAYPPSSPWRGVKSTTFSDEEKEFETYEWKRVRKALRNFLEIDGVVRMSKFAAYDVGDTLRRRTAEHSNQHSGKAFKSTSFVPSDIKYTLPLYLEQSSPPISDLPPPITLLNPSGLSEKKVLSYIKYLFRSRGILYHCLPISHGESAILQLVLPYPNQSSENLAVVPTRSDEKDVSWVSSLFSLGGPKRSLSVPPQKVSRATPPPKIGTDKKGLEWALKCWIKIEVEKVKRPNMSRAGSRRGSEDVSPSMPTSPLLGSTGQLMSALTTLEEGKAGLTGASGGTLQHQYNHTGHTYNYSHSSHSSAAPTPRSQSVEPAHRSTPQYSGPLTGRNASTTRVARRPHPLSRQVSIESKSESSHTTTTTTTSSKFYASRYIPRISIHLSDPRAYGIIKMALDVKHVEIEDDTNTTSSLSPKSPAMTITRMTEIVQGFSDMDGEDKEHQVQERERGRPRSKEEPKVLIRTTTHGDSSNEDGQDDYGARRSSSKSTEVIHVHGDPESAQRPEPVRGRKVGFLDAWFGFGSGDSDPIKDSKDSKDKESHEAEEAKKKAFAPRSASSPPSRDQVEPVVMLSPVV